MSMARKFLERLDKFHVVGKLDWEGIPLILTYDNLKKPEGLNVVKDGETIARIKIPTSYPNEINIISGNLNEFEKKDVLKIFRSEIGGIPGWESLLIAMDPLTSD